MMKRGVKPPRHRAADPQSAGPEKREARSAARSGLARRGRDGRTVAGWGTEIPRPVDPKRGLAAAGLALVAVRLTAARPNEGEGFAVLDEVGVDRYREARIVELDREIVAALVGALRPRGPDLGTADIDPMAGGVVARAVSLGDDADALALQAQGDDLALELVAGLLEGADICHVTSPWLFEPTTIAASMAICRPKAMAAAPVFGPERSGGWRG